MVPLAALMAAMLVLGSGVALSVSRYGSDGGETLYGTLRADTVSGYGGGDGIYGFGGSDLLRGNPGNDRVQGGSGSESIHIGNDEAVAYVECNPDYDRFYLEDEYRYVTDCEMITPVDSHPRSQRSGAG